MAGRERRVWVEVAGWRRVVVEGRLGKGEMETNR